MSTMTYTETLIVTNCWCGITLAVPRALYNHAKESPNNHIYCPIGHKFIFCDTWQEKAEKEQARLADERRRHEATRDLLQAEEQSHRATRGHLTRHKKRASAGVCPCCNRTFQNVARHMSTKHPDFAR